MLSGRAWVEIYSTAAYIKDPLLPPSSLLLNCLIDKHLSL
jgi:hypothetical protein